MFTRIACREGRGGPGAPLLVLVFALAAASVPLVTLRAQDALPAEAVPGLGTPASGWVVDDAGLLPEDERRALDLRLADHEAGTSNQIVVLTVATLGGLEIEEFAVDEANRRGIGQRGRDNGVLFVVAPNERAARIEVGYGLEGTLPDARAGRILRLDVVPRFRAGDYPGGIRAGVEAILATLDGSYRPTLADRLPLQGVLAYFDSMPDIPRHEQVFLGMFFFIFGPLLAILPLAWLRWKGLGGWLGLALFGCVAVLVVRRYPWMPGGIGLFALFLLVGWIDKKSGGRLMGGGKGGAPDRARAARAPAPPLRLPPRPAPSRAAAAASAAAARRRAGRDESTPTCRPRRPARRVAPLGPRGCGSARRRRPCAARGAAPPLPRARRR